MTALPDAEHFATTSKPVMRPPEPQPISGTTLKELAQAQVLAGQPLNDAEEDAMLWS